MKPCQFNKNSVIKALDIADKQIGLLMNFAKKTHMNFGLQVVWVKKLFKENNFRLFLRDFQKTIKF